MIGIRIFAFAGLLLLAFDSSGFAQEGWPSYAPASSMGEHDIARGPGFYFAWWKILLIVLTFFFWVKAADWINRDLQEVGETTKMPIDLWNPATVFTFFAGFLIVVTLPIFWIGFPVYFLLATVPFFIYVFQRNAEVNEEEKVFTRKHIFGRLRGGKKAVQEQMKPLAQDEGPPVEFVAAGADKAQSQTNLISARQSPAFLSIKAMFSDAVMRRAEVVRFDFTRDAVKLAFQIDGLWQNMAQMDRPTGDEMLVAMKRLGNLDPQERRNKQEGDFSLKLPDRAMNCLIRSRGVKTGEEVLLYLTQKKKKPWTLAELGMLPETEKRLKTYLNSPGYVVVSSMPGDGLSTTWVGTLTAADRVTRDFVGFADVSYRETVVENIEFQRFDLSKEETPEKLLRNVLLKQPEAIVVPDPVNAKCLDMLVDQILDEKRFVISQVRAKSASEALLRMIAYKPDRTKISRALTASLYSRLMRRLCDYCKESYPAPPELIKRLNLNPAKPPTLFKPFQPPPPESLVDAKGRPLPPPPPCAVCNGLGYIGRIAIFELLVIDDQVRRALVNESSVEAIAAAAKAAGNSTLQEEGLKVVLAGVTSLAELQRVLKQS
jgi:type II secretory ATPase GspE/PulE/Tfp pilus assembly ATPase PilB-like protein